VTWLTKTQPYSKHSNFVKHQKCQVPIKRLWPMIDGLFTRDCTCGVRTH